MSDNGNIVPLMSREEREAWGRHERAYQAAASLPPVEKMALIQALIVSILAECHPKTLSALLGDLRHMHTKLNGKAEVRRLREATK